MYFFIAIGLAMDAFAVSITSGALIKNLKYRNAFQIAFFFGAFQAIMPFLGWWAGLRVRDYISEMDHWVAFGLLCLIGGKMVYESFQLEKEELPNPLHIPILLLLSVATSIDALVVGITFAFLDISIVTPVLIIGAITFLFSFTGVFLGNKFGHLFEGKIEIIGGLVLIGIGIKILVEHLSS